MTKSQLVKKFRMLTLKLGQANIPMIVTNHTYDVIGSYVPTKEMEEAVPQVRNLFISARKSDYCPKPYQAKTAKSRLSKENKDVTVRLYYDDVVLIDIMVFLNSVNLVVSGRTLQVVMR